MFAFYEGFDHVNNLFDMISDARFHVRLSDVQRCHILMVGSCETFSDQAYLLAGFN